VTSLLINNETTTSTTQMLNTTTTTLMINDEKQEQHNMTVVDVAMDQQEQYENVTIATNMNNNNDDNITTTTRMVSISDDNNNSSTTMTTLMNVTIETMMMKDDNVTNLPSLNSVENTTNVRNYTRQFISTSTSVAPKRTTRDTTHADVCLFFVCFAFNKTIYLQANIDMLPIHTMRTNILTVFLDIHDILPEIEHEVEVVYIDKNTRYGC
jgi:hypothetical protein